MSDEDRSHLVYQRKPAHLYEATADDKFDVVVPKKAVVLFLIIFTVLFLAQFFYFTGFYSIVLLQESYDPAEFYWWVPLVFLATAFVIVLAWGQIGSRIAAHSIVKYLKRTVNKKKPGPLEIIMGFPMRTKDKYYLEAYPVDLNLGSDFVSKKIFLKRVLEVLFLSMGMSVMISQMVAPYIYEKVATYDPSMYKNMEEMIIDMTIYLGPFTLLILMFVMPVFWIAEDIQAYRINQAQDSVRVGFYLRTGMLSKILSFFGIVLVFNLAQAFAEASVGNSVSADVAFNIYITTAIWFLLIIAMCAAIPFLVSLMYLSYFHQRWVNNVRIKASEFMPLGTLEVEKIPPKANLKYLGHPEMLNEERGFFQKPIGFLVLFALIIAVAIVCIYMAFILGFEGALF